MQLKEWSRTATKHLPISVACFWDDISEEDDGRWRWYTRAACSRFQRARPTGARMAHWLQCGQTEVVVLLMPYAERPCLAFVQTTHNTEEPYSYDSSLSNKRWWMRMSRIPSPRAECAKGSGVESSGARCLQAAWRTMPLCCKSMLSHCITKDLPSL